MSVFEPISLIKKAASAGSIVSNAMLENARSEPNHYIESVSPLALDIAPIESMTTVEIQPSSAVYGSYDRKFELNYMMPTTGNLLNIFLVFETDRTPFSGATTAALTRNPYRLIDVVNHKLGAKTFYSTDDVANSLEYIESSTDEKQYLEFINGGVLNGAILTDLTANDYKIMLPLKLPRYNDLKNCSQSLDAYNVGNKYVIQLKLSPSDLFETTGTVTNASPFKKIYLVAQVGSVDDIQTQDIIKRRFENPLPVKDYITFSDTFTPASADTELIIDMNSFKNQNIANIGLQLITETDYDSAAGAWNYLPLQNLPHVAAPRISAFYISESGKKIVDYTTDSSYGVVERYRSASEFNIFRSSVLFDLYTSDDDNSSDQIPSFLQTDSFRNFKLSLTLENMNPGVSYRYIIIATTVKALFYDERGNQYMEN